MLSVKKLSCIRGDRRLFRDLSFSVESGEIMRIHGPNGAGKTTLLRSISGLMVPDEGEIAWDGQPVKKIGDEFFNHLLYLGHKNALKDEFTAFENLNVIAQLAGVDDVEEEVVKALKGIGLAHCADLPVKVLSQGQQRRVALSRLLMSRAKLWILDEPFSALDAKSVDVLQKIIIEHIENGGMVLLTTHQEVEVTNERVRRLDLAA